MCSLNSPNPSTWDGLRFPTRLLTSDEIELFSPRCCKCGIPACVVEMDKEQKRHYCALHSPLDNLPEEVERKSDKDFFESLKVQIDCDKQKCKRYATSCLQYHLACAKKCKPILNLLNKVSPDAARAIIRSVKNNNVASVASVANVGNVKNNESK